MDSRYRACVLAVFSNAEGQVLVAQRGGDGQGVWQFPQGGMEPDESPEEALFREMREELGSTAFDVLERAADVVRYVFPEGMSGPYAREFCGQEQVWFHARFRDGAGPDLGRASDREFGAVEWVTPAEAMRRAVPVKKDAYRRGLAALGLLAPGEGEED